jgi:hypothetical protein
MMMMSNFCSRQTLLWMGVQEKRKSVEDTGISCLGDEANQSTGMRLLFRVLMT